MIYGKKKQRYIDWGNAFANPYEEISVWVRKDNMPEDKRWAVHMLRESDV